MFQYHIASNYYISLLWGVLMELQVVVACFSAPPKFFSGSATAEGQVAAGGVVGPGGRDT